MNLGANFPGWMAALALVSTVSVGCAWIAALWLRRRSAAWRHWVWLLAIGAPLLALPLTWTPLRISWAILPSAPGQPAATTPIFFASPILPQGKPTAEAAPAVSTPPAKAARTAHRSLRWPINPCAGAWAFGTFLALARVLHSHLGMRRLLREHSSPAPEELLSHLETVKRHWENYRAVRLSTTSLRSIPFCYGFVRPAILLPEGAGEWSDERVEICLAHELAHIVRGDLWAIAAAQLSCALCWFNPLIWLAAAKLRDEAEQAADDLVLTHGAGPETYTGHLLAITEQFHAARLSASALSLAMARPNRLGARIHAILDPAVARHSPPWRRLLGLGMLAFGLFTAAMTVRLTAAPAGKSASTAHTEPAPVIRDLDKLESRERSSLWNEAFAAIRVGDVETIRSYLRRGLDVNVDLVSDCSLLYLAVSFSQPEIVKLLISHGAEVQQKTHSGDTCIRRACYQGNREVLDALMAAGAVPDERLYAIGTGDLAALEARNTRQPITPAEAREGLDYAVAAGRPNTFDWLWLKLAPVEEAQKEKLLEDFYASAASSGQLNMLKRLEAMGLSFAKVSRQAMVLAAGANRPAVVRYLLEHGASANEVPPRWGSMLRDTAGEGYLEVVRLLLEHGADPNVRAAQGQTPLGWAAYRGKEDVCLLLLEHGTDVNSRDDFGRNAAWDAAGGAHCDRALEVMLKQGVDVFGTDQQGETILRWLLRFVPPRPGQTAYPGTIYTAAEQQAYEARERRVIALLAGAGVDLNELTKDGTALMEAMKEGHYAAAQALIELGADVSTVDQYGNNALYYLIGYSRESPFPIEILQSLLQHGANPRLEFHYPNTTPLLPVVLLVTVLNEAVRPGADFQNLREAMKLLIQHGAAFPKGSDERTNALLNAAAVGDLAQMQRLVEQGAPISGSDAHGWDALSIAVSLRYAECANWLLDRGAEPAGSPERPWYGALSAAVETGQIELVERLIAKGAHPAQIPNLLYMAVEQKNPRLLELLIKSGASVASSISVTVTANGKSYTPLTSNTLYLCIQNGLPEMARTLLRNGADPDPRGLERGLSLVHCAVAEDQPEILRELLDHGADAAQPDEDGKTPLDVAKKDHSAMMPILESAINRAPPAP